MRVVNVLTAYITAVIVVKDDVDDDVVGDVRRLITMATSDARYSDSSRCQSEPLNEN